jgi:hypothetical protein
MRKLEIYDLLSYANKEIIDDLVFNALREAGHEPTDLTWNLSVEFNDDNEAE